MVKLNVLELLKKKGKTKYLLYNQLDMSYTNYNNIIMNKTKSIKYENTDKFCKILESDPNDLFTYLKEFRNKIANILLI